MGGRMKQYFWNFKKELDICRITFQGAFAIFFLIQLSFIIMEYVNPLIGLIPFIIAMLGLEHEINSYILYFTIKKQKEFKNKKVVLQIKSNNSWLQLRVK